MMSHQRREEWLAQRRRYVTASDIAVLLGESKHKSREQLTKEKLGESDGFTGSEYTDLALRLEEPVLRIAEARYGWEIVHNETLIVDPECDRHAATPDGVFMSPWGLVVVQVKWTTSLPTEDCKPLTKKGEPSTAAYLHGPPLYYQLQVQSEMACTGAVAGVLLVMHTTPGLKLRPYYIKRHDGVISKIRREVVRFWKEIEQ